MPEEVPRITKRTTDAYASTQSLPSNVPPPRSWDASPINIEISPSNIAITAPIDLNAFLAGDMDVCQVAAKVPVGWSYNGWYYTEQAVKDVAYWIGMNGIVGNLGHVEDEKAAYEFKDVAVIWVGAQYDEIEKATYARGYVNPERSDVKRLIRSGVINRVSPDAIMHCSKNADGFFVVETLELLSLDLVPRLRNGTESGIAAKDMVNDESACAGEVKETLSEDVNREETAGTGTPEPQAEQHTDPAVGLEGAAPDSASPAGPVIDAELQDAIAQLGENPAQRIKGLLNMENIGRMKQAEELFTVALKDMVEGEDAQELVSLMVKPQAGDTRETISARITDCLNEPKLKKILASRFNSPTVKGSPPKDTGKPKIIYQNY